MPIVTAIERQKRDGARYSIYLDGVYVLALSDLELSNSGLRAGQEVSSEEVERLHQQADQERMYALALRFVGLRPRSIKEMQDYLRRKGAPETTGQAVVARLTRAGLLNDQAFAAGWVADRQAVRPRSRRRLEQELLAKGLARETIATSLAGFDTEAELTALEQVVRKKQRLATYQDRDKLMAYLARQGYGYEVIKKALERLDEPD